MNIVSEHEMDRLARGLAPVLDVMSELSCDFDEARLHMVQQAMAAMGIDQHGLPSDPKLVTFSSSPSGQATITVAPKRRRSQKTSLRTFGCFWGVSILLLTQV
jgi:hypothetical protein